MYKTGILSAALMLIFNACTPSVHPSSEHPASFSVKAKHTPLKKYLYATDKPLKGKSAFYPLPLPDDAFAARIFLIDHAVKSLDLQYYIYEDDLVGKVLSAHLLKAAQRGVKIRILLDDISTAGKDHALALLAHHPNIQLRLFNPNRLRTFFRNMALLLDLNTLGKRMHNKALIADGYAAVIGGRNIGNVYFTAQSDTIFLDYDMLSIGSIVPKVSKAFDLYWNSPLAVPEKEVLSTHDVQKNFVAIEKKLDASLTSFQHTATGQKVEEASFMQKIRRHTLQFIVADKTTLYYDHPDKVITAENDTTYHISSQIGNVFHNIRHDLIVISPYFVPNDTVLQAFKALRTRGVHITVITNSLASTDVFPVYSGYQEYIEPLVKMGVVLYELKPHSLAPYLKRHHFKKKLNTSLHTKLVMIDTSRMFVGSANLDPRSDKLNTEIVMDIVSDKLTTMEHKEIVKIVTPEHFYRVTWGEHPRQALPYQKSYGPIWITKENGKLKTYYAPPKSPLLKTFATDLLSLLPIKGYL